MTHLPDRASTAATAFCALALALAAASPAAAQPQIPAMTTWYALPGVVPAGTTVVVRTRDGQSTKGRVSSLSDTAIVLEGGRVKSFPAADVVAIEGPREGRAVKRGAMLGIAFGSLFGLGMAAYAADEAFCRPDERVTWTDALIGALVLPAMGAGAGAGIGLMVPGTHIVVYRAEQPPSPATAPIPVAATWDAVPQTIAQGANVVVRTRDGRSAKGRLRGVSATDIVVESGSLMTIPATDVASIEERRGRQWVRKGANAGFAVGVMFAVVFAGGAMSTEYCDCDNGTARENALLGALFAPAVGAGIGAGIGLMVPGRRAVIYRQPVGPGGVSLAPIAGRGRRGVAVRVAF